MYVSLWERDADSLGVKALFHVLRHIEEYIPIIRRLDPWAHHKVYTAIRQFTDSDFWLRLFQDTVVLGEDFHQDLLCLGKVSAVAYTDDQIVGKINAASANITRAGSIEGTAASALDSDDIGEGSGNLYDTGTPIPALTDNEVVTAINNASSAITREAALSQDDLKIVKTAPLTGEFQVKNIHRDAAGLLDIEYDDVAES